MLSRYSTSENVDNPQDNNALFSGRVAEGPLDRMEAPKQGMMGGDVESEKGGSKATQTCPGCNYLTELGIW